MPDYSNAKIYKIQCSTGHYYYGSTTSRLLCQRMAVHRRDSQKHGNRNNKLYEHMNAVGWDNAEIILVQSVRCNSRDELLQAENAYILGAWGDDKCLNGNIAYRNPDDRPYVERVTCECGKECPKNNLKRHQSSIKHRNNMATLQQTARQTEEPVAQ